MSDAGEKVPLDTGEFLFRFRSSKALLDDDLDNGGYLELERQSIHFAEPETLNDPMEGLTDAFWDGDEVLWENLFRHYALSLVWYAGEWLVRRSDDISQAKVGAWLTEADLPTDWYRQIYKEFASDFCAAIDSRGLAAVLGKRTVPLRRERFTNLLFLIHQTALQHLFRVLEKHRLCPFEWPPGDPLPDQVKLVVDAWERMAEKPPTDTMLVEHQLEIMGRITNRVNHQLELGMLSRVENKDRARKWIAIAARFPETYVEAFLRDLHFTPWRVACFSRRCVNASMWGTYGHDHRGAVLVFRTTERENRHCFRVHGMIGTGAHGTELEVRPVQYQSRPPSLDGFLEIGMLPQAKLENTWMRSQAGEPSTRLHEIAGDMRAWRKAHWDKSFERATWKHPDWSHEDELRLIASTPFTDDPAPGPLTYEFSQLEGIVFGMRMTTEDKLRIAQVLEKKCKSEGREDFRFFQAHYSPQRGEMEVHELGLLTFGEAS